MQITDVMPHLTWLLGNADGLGSIRKKELVKSCQTFGIQTSHVKSLDLPYVCSFEMSSHMSHTKTIVHCKTA